MTYGAIQFLQWATIAALVGAAYLLLPSAESYPLPNEVGDAIALFASYMKTFEFIFPVTLLFNLVALTVTFEIVIFVFKRAIWIISLYSGSGR